MVVCAMTIQLIWPDGGLVSGASFREVEDALRASQWHTFKDRHDFRQEMRDRAELWSGTRPKGWPFQSSEKFIRSLADSGMCMLVVED